MKRWLLIAVTVTYILPKEQPLFDGMIVRCSDAITAWSVPNGTSTYVIENPKSHCHWECEYGPLIESYIDEGNQKAKMIGCKQHPPVSSDVLNLF